MNGNKTYEAWYWSYGEIRASTETNPSPWGFVGLLGYYTDALNYLYVRARYYRPNLTRWQTVDPLWSLQEGYIYGNSDPITNYDPSGLQAADCQRCAGDPVPSQCESPAIRNAITAALRKYCSKTCPNLNIHQITCWMFAESNCNPGARTGPNDGLFQISSNIWYGYCRDLGPFDPYNPILNATCAIEALCKAPRKGHPGFHCSFGAWGTHVEPGSQYDCCNRFGRQKRIPGK